MLSRLLEPAADDVRTRRAEAHGQGGAPVLRRYADTRYGAKSWGCERRVAARIEASSMGLDIRCVVTNLRAGSAEFTTLRLRLLKIAGRVTETATRVRVAFAAACPEAELFRGIARSLQLAGP